MLYAVFAAFAAASMVSFLMSVSLSSDRSARSNRQASQSRYLTEGALEVGKQALASAVTNRQPVPATGTVTIDGRAVDYSIQPTGFATIQVDPSGIQTMLTGYMLTSSTTVEASGAVSNRLVTTHATPIFQFAVFYDNDLEINPGPAMTLGGRVHTNADMYLNCGSTLAMNTNYVRAAGEMRRHRKDNNGVSTGRVDIRQWVRDPYDLSEPLSYFEMNGVPQMNALGIPTVSGFDSAFDTAWDADGDGFIGQPPDEWLPWGAGALAYWAEPSGYAFSGNTVMTGEHGVGQAMVPGISSIQMFEPDAGGSHYFEPSSGTYVPAAFGGGTHSPGYYHAEADLVILTLPDGSLQATTGAGVDVTATLLSSGAVKLGGMYDARQAGSGPGNIAVADIDLKALPKSLWPANGLLYAAHYGAGTGTSAKGVRLVNGAALHMPLTVATENSLYVKGDFNTVEKKGAAVIADAVNLLSNDWKNNKTSSSQLPRASETTFNLAFITGNTDTVGSTYNGGLENLPRFHEDWAGVNCNIRGSLVNTWTSKYANAPWTYGGKVYTAPRRNWTYDTAFNSVANLPPFTPMAVTAEDVAVW